MTHKGIFGMTIKYDGVKIVDQDVNTLEDMDNIFNDVKKKFK